MTRYLLFDAGCTLCTRVTEDVEAEAGHWLEARSIDDPDMIALLNSARPGWKRRPTLVIVEGDNVTAYTGALLTLRLTSALGVRSAGRIARRLSRTLQPETPASSSRRDLLRSAGAGVTALAGLAFLPKVASAEDTEASGLLSDDALAEAVRRTNEAPEVVAAKRNIEEQGYATTTDDVIA